MADTAALAAATAAAAAQPRRPPARSPPRETRWDPAAVHHASANGHIANGHAVPSIPTRTSSTTASPLPPTSSPTPPTSFRVLPPTPPSILPGGRHSLAGVAVRAAGIGAVLGMATLGGGWLAAAGDPLWRVPFYVAMLAAFHFLEFYTTAAHNTAAASVKAFLLSSNGAAYNAAHAAALLETIVRHTILAQRTVVESKALGAAALVLGFVLVILGQACRSMAMAHAGTNFNHLVQSQRKSGHVLVTHGLYAHLRHPAYFGFFWWGLGSQLVLGNWLSFAAYSVVLWYFFSDRIQKEEQFLVRFFGDEYLDYRKRTRVGIPFIR